MWHNYPFSQRNKKIEKAVGVAVGGDRERGSGQNLKSGGSQYRGGLHKIGGLGPLCQLWALPQLTWTTANLTQLQGSV